MRFQFSGAWLCLVFAIGFLSCGGGGGKVSIETPPGGGGGAPSSDIYVVGSEASPIGNYNSFAKLWKNGTSISLTEGTREANAFSVAISGTDVYVVGYESNGTRHVAKIWKNGIATSLSDGSSEAEARAIVIDSGVVYVAGMDAGKATLWKNGVATSITDGKHLASCTSLAVSGGDVYVGGGEGNDAGYNVLKVWKNGVATTQAIGGGYDCINGVAVSGTDVYAVGNFAKNIGGTAYLAGQVWKNGVANPLTVVPADNSFANACFVSGTDLYVLGIDIGSFIGACYWKNGNQVVFGALGSQAFGGCMVGSDLYAVGYGGDSRKATYWKNGVEINLTTGIPAARAWGMAVVNH